MAEARSVSVDPSGRVGRLDAVFNVAGSGIAGVSGVILLGLIGASYGAEELGRFSILFATYLVISQVTTLAIHHGVLHHLGTTAASVGGTRRAILLGALVAVSTVAVAASFALWMAAPSVLEALGRGELLPGVRWTIAAAAVFSVNKVLMGALNALARFRSLAVATGLRGVALIGAGTGLVLAGTPGSGLAAILLVAELSLFAVLVLLLRKDLRTGQASLGGVLAWTRELLRFGIRGAAGGVLLGINARVDVLCLGILVDDTSVGVYTIAALLAEALLQIPVVVRTLLSPRVVRLIEARDSTGLRSLMRSMRRRLWPWMGLACLAAWMSFPVAVSLLRDPGFGEARTALAILVLGVWVASAMTPFTLILAQGGDASAQSSLLTAAVSVNIVGNLLLIPLLGIEGAAIATATSTVLGASLIRPMVRRRLGLAV